MRGISSGDAFKARTGGTCNTCGKKYRPGDWIVGQGKGYGAIHNRCKAATSEPPRPRGKEPEPYWGWAPKDV